MEEPKAPIWIESRGRIGVEIGVRHECDEVVMSFPVKVDVILLAPCVARAVAESLIRHADWCESGAATKETK